MDIRLPQIAEGADSGTVVNVLVAKGDAVVESQDLLEVETQKAVVTIPSPSAGTVEQIHVAEGDTVRVDQLLVSLQGGQASAPKAPSEKAAAPAAPAPTPEGTAPSTPSAPVAPLSLVNPDPVTSPSIRKQARNLGIDLTLVPGTGRGGRILLEDVRAYIVHLQELAARRAPEATRAPAEPPRPMAPAVDFAKWGPVSKQPVTPLRRTVSQRMHASWSEVPHVTQFDNADITGLMALRKKQAPKYEKQGARLTLTPFVLKAVVAALQKHPRFNSSLDADGRQLVLKEYIHVGIAVDTEAGLMVPVIRDVDKKSLLELAQETEQLAEKARSRKISPEELQGGSFTISNQGALGGAHFTPIINHPEVAILGLGRASLQPLIVDGRVSPRQVMPLTLSYDHRVVDGADAVRFVRELVDRLENPDEPASPGKPARSAKKAR